MRILVSFFRAHSAGTRRIGDLRPIQRYQGSHDVFFIKVPSSIFKKRLYLAQKKRYSALTQPLKSSRVSVHEEIYFSHTNEH